MFHSTRSLRGRIVGALCLTAFLAQLSVIPLLHARHATGGSGQTLLDIDGQSTRNLSPAVDDPHDGRSCPICAVLAKSRVGIVPLGSFRQTPPVSFAHFPAAPHIYFGAERSHTAEPRAPPTLSL